MKRVATRRRRNLRKTTRRSSRRRHNLRKTTRSSRRRRNLRGGSAALPVTTWGEWSGLPGSTAWSPTSSAPAPLANGGLYTGPQSTGEWASKPFPATQYAMSVESARVSGQPDVFFHQRPTTDVGGSWSPYVGQSISPQHWSARMPSV